MYVSHKGTNMEGWGNEGGGTNIRRSWKKIEDQNVEDKQKADYKL